MAIFLSATQAAKLLGISTFCFLANADSYPFGSIQISPKRRKWLKADIEVWLASQLEKDSMTSLSSGGKHAKQK